MFVGHFGVAFGGKRAAPAVSLGTLFLAAQFLDLLWPAFLLLGLEEVRVAPGITKVTGLDFVSYPYSHSLVAAASWSVLFGVAHWAVKRRPSSSVLLGGLVFSHWVLDFVTHRPDLPLTIGADATRVGLGLWNSWAGTLSVELALFAGGVALYGRATAARDGAGRWGLAGLVAFLLASYAAALLVPPPSDPKALAWGGQAVWLLVAWGWWINRHRETRKP